MVPREYRTESVGRAAANQYLNKADQFLKSGEDCLAAGRWDAAALGAVHAAISYGDAALAAVTGLRSKDADHSALVTLLEQRVAAFSGPSRRHLIGLLSAKNSVEYEHRLTTEAESRQMVDHARRFGRWARGVAQA